MRFWRAARGSPPKEGLPPQQPQMGLFGKKKAKVAATDEDAAGEAAAPGDDVAAEDVESEDRKADDASRKPKPRERQAMRRARRVACYLRCPAQRREKLDRTDRPRAPFAQAQTGCAARATSTGNAQARAPTQPYRTRRRARPTKLKPRELLNDSDKLSKAPRCQG